MYHVDSVLVIEDLELLDEFPLEGNRGQSTQNGDESFRKGLVWLRNTPI
jgi:hypothetical protein